MRVVGVSRPEIEMVKKLIVAGLDDPDLIADQTGVDRETVVAFVNQWTLWRANDCAALPTLSVEH